MRKIHFKSTHCRNTHNEEKNQIPWINLFFFFLNFLGRVAVCKPWLIFADGNRSGGTCQKKKEIKWAYLMRREINDWKYSNEKRN